MSWGKIIVESLSNASLFSMGSMIVISHNYWMLIPMIGIIIFYGLSSSYNGEMKERRKNLKNNNDYHSVK